MAVWLIVCLTGAAGMFTRDLPSALRESRDSWPQELRKAAEEVKAAFQHGEEAVENALAKGQKVSAESVLEASDEVNHKLDEVHEKVAALGDASRPTALKTSTQDTFFQRAAALVSQTLTSYEAVLLKLRTVQEVAGRNLRRLGQAEEAQQLDEALRACFSTANAWRQDLTFSADRLKAGRNASAHLADPLSRLLRSSRLLEELPKQAYEAFGIFAEAGANAVSSLPANASSDDVAHKKVSHRLQRLLARLESELRPVPAAAQLMSRELAAGARNVGVVVPDACHRVAFSSIILGLALWTW